MLIKLFDYSNGVLVPSEHCYAMDSFKQVIEDYPKDYLKVFLYIFYMIYPDPEQNPFFNMAESEREELVLREIKIDFSLDSPSITKAMDTYTKICETPTRRAYEGAKSMMEKLAVLFKTHALTTGREGSLDSMVRTMEKYDKLRQSYKGVEKDYLEEVKAVTRGGSYTSYDQQ